MKNKFSNIWASYFKKKKATFVDSGSTAIFEALKLLKSKKVIIPTYTCHRVLNSTLKANCTPIIVDCDLSLQVDLSQIKEINADTIIVPHMFGIQSNVKKIKELNKFKIIEDCSQCIGLPELGTYADIVIASTGPSKWISVGIDKDQGGGIIAYNEGDIKWWDEPTFIHKANMLNLEIENKLKIRTEKAKEIIKAGVNLIGKDMPNSWLRAVYIGDTLRKRECYTPLHDLYGSFDCPKTDSYKDYIDWISIFD